MRLNIQDEFLNEETRLGFTIPAKMKRSWAAQLKLLSMIDDICARHGLKWFVDYGSLLGVVRHNGFIPWDDDIDIAMFREDYDRLFEIVPHELPEYCHAMKFGTEGNYSRGWSNINNRHEIDTGYDEEAYKITESFFGSPFVDGIDIYPLDYVPADEGRRADMFTSFETILNELRHNKGLSDAERIYLCEQAETIARSCSKEDSIGVGTITVLAHFNPDNWRSLSWYEQTTLKPFESIRVPVPCGYSAILNQIYGPEWSIPKQARGAHDYPFYAKQEEYIIGFIIDETERLFAAGDIVSASEIIRDGILRFPTRYEMYHTAARIMQTIDPKLSADLLAKSRRMMQDLPYTTRQEEE